MKISEIILEGQDKNVDLASIIAASIQAKKSLSLSAKHAIDQWQASNWDSGALDAAYRINNPLADEITHAFAPVARVIADKYGSTITLYRGQREFEVNELNNNRVLFSWTADPAVAKHFAHNTAVMYPEITPDEITKALHKFQTRGFVQIADRVFMRSKDDPEYYIIYRNHAYVTDGLVDNLASDLKNIAQDRVNDNAKISARGRVVTAKVPISLIVWVANDLNSKEFIVKLNPMKLNT